LQCLQLLARLEAHCLSGRDGNLRSRARIPPDTGFTRFEIENAKATQFDAVTLLESLLHGFEDSLDRHLGFGLGNAGPIHYFVDNV
jgi:hypothetical protein